MDVFLIFLLSEAPEVFVSDKQLSVSLGKRVSVSCNVSGHPPPELYWLNKRNGLTLVRDKHMCIIHNKLETHEHIHKEYEG